MAGLPCPTISRVKKQRAGKPCPCREGFSSQWRAFIEFRHVQFSMFLRFSNGCAFGGGVVFEYAAAG